MLSAPVAAALQHEQSWTLVAAGTMDVDVGPALDANDGVATAADAGIATDVGADPTPREPAPGCSARTMPTPAPWPWLTLAAGMWIALVARRRRAR